VPLSKYAITPTRERLAGGDGWSVSAVTVAAAAGERAFEQRHDLASIAVVTSGSFHYRSHRGATTLAAGAWLLGNAGRDYACAWPHATGDRAIAFAYAPDCLDGVARALAGVTRSDFPTHRIPPVPATLPLGALVAAHAASRDAARWEELALTIASEALAQAAAVARRPPSARDEARIGAALRTIERRSEEPLTIAGLAAEARMSPYHFLRVFRDVVGVTPYQFLLRTRLRHAAVALASGREPIASIAFGAGFGDLSTFVTTFRRVFGLAPRDYRATARRRTGESLPARDLS
jgi:AraC-like DNA-binding protein